MKPEIDVHAWMGNVKWVMRKERQGPGKIRCLQRHDHEKESKEKAQ